MLHVYSIHYIYNMHVGPFHVKEGQKTESFNPPSQSFLKSSLLLHTIKTRRNTKSQPSTPNPSKVMVF